MEGLKLSNEDLHILIEHAVYFDKSNGYYRVLIKGRDGYVYLHRLILNAKDGDIVDHIDMDKQNNTRENLRIVSKSINNFNKVIDNKLGRGIYFDKYGNRYRACISVNNKTIKIGSFSNLEDAKLAYNIKSLELRGSNGYQHTDIMDKPHFELKK